MRIYLYKKIYEFNNAILNCKNFPRKIDIFLAKRDVIIYSKWKIFSLVFFEF